MGVHGGARRRKNTSSLTLLLLKLILKLPLDLIKLLLTKTISTDMGFFPWLEISLINIKIFPFINLICGPWESRTATTLELCKMDGDCIYSQITTYKSSENLTKILINILLLGTNELIRYGFIFFLAHFVDWFSPVKDSLKNYTRSLK